MFTHFDPISSTMQSLISFDLSLIEQRRLSNLKGQFLATLPSLTVLYLPMCLFSFMAFIILSIAVHESIVDTLLLNILDPVIGTVFILCIVIYFSRFIVISIMSSGVFI